MSCRQALNTPSALPRNIEDGVAENSPDSKQQGAENIQVQRKLSPSFTLASLTS